MSLRVFVFLVTVNHVGKMDEGRVEDVFVGLLFLGRYPFFSFFLFLLWLLSLPFPHTPSFLLTSHHNVCINHVVSAPMTFFFSCCFLLPLSSCHDFLPQYFIIFLLWSPFASRTSLFLRLPLPPTHDFFLPLPSSLIFFFPFSFFNRACHTVYSVQK